MKPTRTLARASRRILHYTTSQVVLLLAGIGLIYVALLFVLNSSLSSVLVDRFFNDHFKGSMNWDRLHFGPLPWQLEVVGLKINEPNGEPVILADGMRIDRIDLANILGGHVQIDGVTLINPKIHLRMVPRRPNEIALGKGATVINIQQVFEPLVPTPSDPNAQMEVVVRDIRIRNADLIYQTEDVNVLAKSLAIKGVNFRLAIAPSGGDMGIDARILESAELEVKVAREQPKSPLSWALSELELRGFNWMGNRFTIQSLQSLLERDPLLVSNFMMELKTGMDPIMTIDARLNSEEVKRHVAQFGLANTQGPVDLKLKGSGAVKSFTGSLSLRSPRLSVEGYSNTQTMVKARIQDGRHLTLLPSTTQIFGGKTQLSGKLDLFSGEGEMAVSGQSLTLNTINGLNRRVRFGLNEGKLTANLKIQTMDLFRTGRKIATQGTLTLARTNPAMPLARRLKVTLKGEYEKNRLSFETLNAKSRDERIQIKGWFNHASKQLNARGNIYIAELGPLLELWNVPLSGKVNARFEADGRISNPNVSVTLFDTQLNYGGIEQVGVSGKARLSNQKVQIRNLRLMAKEAGIAILGTVNLQRRDPGLQLSLITENLELGMLNLPNSLSGRASLEIDLTGSVKVPAAAVRGRLRNFCFAPKPNADVICLDGVETKSNVSRDKFSLESLKLRDSEWGTVTAFGDGSIKRKSFAGTVKVADFPLLMLDRVLPSPLGISGTLDADLSVGGTLKRPLGGGKIEIQGLKYDRYELGNATLLALANEDSSTLQALMLDGQRLIVKLPFDKNARPTAELRLKNFVPKKWLPQLKDVPLTAKLSGSAHAEFKDRSFELSSARLNLGEVDCDYALDGFRVYLRPEGNIAVSWKDNSLQIERLRIDVLTQTIVEGDPSDKIESMSIAVKGRIPELKRFELEYEGNLSMAGVRPFIKGTFSSAEGGGTFSGRLTGPLKAPKPDMELRVESATLIPRSSVIGTLVELQDPLVLNLKPSSDAAKPGDWRLQRSPLDGQKPTRILRDESTFELGRLSVDFERFLPRRIVVGTSVFDLALRVPGILSATINAPNLEVEWSTSGKQKLLSSPELKIAGDIEVQSGVYVKDITGVNEINEGVRNRLIGRSATQTVNASERYPILKRLKLDLSVSGDGDFFVRNRITVFSLDLEIRIGLEKIRGYLYPAPGDQPEDQLNILGDVTILPDSKLIYARRDFEVNRGIIDFGKGQFMDASIEASRTFTLRSNRSAGVTSTQFDRGGGDVRLEEVNLTARIQQPSLQGEPKISMNLSSNSGASKFDVAMLVLTGSYPEDASSAASAQPATQVLLAPLLNLVERPLEDTLDIDLSLTPATAGSLFIDIDKMLSRRLRLYSRVFVGDSDDANPQQFGLEYQINNTVIGEFTSEQTANYLSTAGRFRLKLELD